MNIEESRRYKSNVHTVEALRQQIEQLCIEDPALMIMGSIGRSVIHRQKAGNPYLEYQARKQDPLYHFDTNEARDIDIVGTPRRHLTNPFKVDNIVFYNTVMGLYFDGSDWILRSDVHGFMEKLDPRVMQPIEGEGIFGIKARTINPQTALALATIRYQRPKDKLTTELLAESIGNISEVIPLELYEPFERFAELQRSPKGLFRKMYKTYIPERITNILSPFVHRFNPVGADPLPLPTKRPKE